MSNTNDKMSNPNMSDKDKVDEIVNQFRASPLAELVTDWILMVNLWNPKVDGVVLDATEPNGGYVDSEELASNQVYLVLGVGPVAPHRAPGVYPLDVD